MAKDAPFLLESNPGGIHYGGMYWLLTAVAGYLLGSFPSGYLVGMARGVDLRKVGSGNIGATNALRTLGKKWGYLVFATDVIKGALAVWVARLIGMQVAPQQEVLFGVLGAICAVAGHMFPVWLGFKGGKGIATSAGIMIALFPIAVFIAGFLVWMILFFTTRYASVASLGAAVSMPTSSAILTYMGHCDMVRTAIAAVMCILAIWRHKTNIQRLLAGTEKKFVKN